MFRLIFTDFKLETFKDGTLLNLGMDIQDYIIVLVTVAIVFAVSVMNEKGKSVRTLVQQKICRYGGLYISLLSFI